MESEWSKHYSLLVPDATPESVHRFREQHGGIVTAEQIARGILPYTVVNNVNYTLHDLDHSFRVCQNINKVVPMLPGPRPNETEMEILYQSALLHDIGMAFISRDRESGVGVKHGALSAIVLRSISGKMENDGFFKLGSPEMVDAVCRVVESHTMPVGSIDGDGEHVFEGILENVTVDGTNVRLRMLCAVLCIADGLDIGNKRISNTAYEILTDPGLLVTVSDIVGSQGIPHLGEVSRKHWMAESHTVVEFDSELRLIVIGVKSEDEKKHRQELKSYLEFYFGYLGIEMNVEIRITE